MGLCLFLGVSRGEHMTEIRLWWTEVMLGLSMAAMNRLDEGTFIIINSNEV